MADRTTLRVTELLARLGGAVAASPMRVFAEIGSAVADAAARQRKALELFRPDDPAPLRLGNEAWLLHPSHSPVPFGFRGEATAEFTDWFYGTENGGWLKWRLLTGGAGRGKTRFVRELVQSLKSTDGTVNGGFVDVVALAERPGDLAGFLEVPGDIVFAVDYAERFRDEVSLLLHLTLAMEEALRPSRGRRIRVILISRSYTELWSQLATDHEAIGKFVSSLGGGLERVPLAPLAERVDRRQEVFRDAFAAFDRYFVERWDGTTSRPLPDPLPPLSDAAFADVLLIHLAALAIWHEGAQIGDVSRDSLLHWLLDRERRAWNQSIDRRALDKALRGAPIEQAAALLTYVSVGGTGIMSRGRALELVGGCPLLEGLSGPVLNAIVDIFRELYPGPAWVNGVTPDLLGQFLLRETDDEFLDDLDVDPDEA